MKPGKSLSEFRQCLIHQYTVMDVNDIYGMFSDVIRNELQKARFRRKVVRIQHFDTILGKNFLFRVVAGHGGHTVTEVPEFPCCPHAVECKQLSAAKFVPVNCKEYALAGMAYCCVQWVGCQ